MGGEGVCEEAGAVVGLSGALSLVWMCGRGLFHSSPPPRGAGVVRLMPYASSTHCEPVTHIRTHTQSFAKNAGLYGERIGALHIVAPDAPAAARVKSQLSVLARSEISNPPAHGARLVSGSVLGSVGMCLG